MKEKTFYQFIENNEYEQAFAFLDSLSKDEQHQVLKGVLSFLMENTAVLQNPNMMVVLKRKLKPGKDYAEFHQAWLPPVEKDDTISGAAQYHYFKSPVRVINAVNIEEPDTFSTVLLTTASFEDFEQEYANYVHIEAKRHDAIKNIIEMVDKPQICRVEDSNYFN